MEDQYTPGWSGYSDFIFKAEKGRKLTNKKTH